jgi:hypothetical protein
VPRASASRHRASPQVPHLLLGSAPNTGTPEYVRTSISALERRLGQFVTPLRCCTAGRNLFILLAFLSTDLIVGWVGVNMTNIIATARIGLGNTDIAEDHDPRLRVILLATFLAGFPVLIAAGATFRDANRHTPAATAKSDLDDRGTALKKGDRLSLPAHVPFPIAPPQADDAPPPVEAAPVVEAPHQQLSLATDDDIRQAKGEHQRHRDICPHGRRYYTIEHHRYWRCIR